MSKLCGVCGKVFDNEPKFPMEGGGEMCEDCYLAFQDGKINMDEISDTDREWMEILKNKEEYTVHKIEKTIDALKAKGYKEQAEELEGYLDNYGKDEEEDGKYYNKGKAYAGSKANVWSDYLKCVNYISWGLTTIGGIALGAILGEGFGNSALGGLFGGVFGFFVGFISIATIMMIITMCENISTMTDNTAKILAKLDENNS